MKENKYRRPIPARAVRNGGMDVYDVLTAFGVTCPALAHAVKKMLCPGTRGAKDTLQDLREAAWSLAEAIQFAEDAHADKKAEEFSQSVTRKISDLYRADGAAEYQAANPPLPVCPDCIGCGYIFGNRNFRRCEACFGSGLLPLREGTEVTPGNQS